MAEDRAANDGDVRVVGPVFGRQFDPESIYKAEAAGRTCRVIEILVQKALAFEVGGDGGSALDTLGQALSLAEPEGYVRVFADEGRPLKNLLSKEVLDLIAQGLSSRQVAETLFIALSTVKGHNQRIF